MVQRAFASRGALRRSALHGALLYRNDGNHLNMSGARRVGVMLRKALANISGAE